MHIVQKHALGLEPRVRAAGLGHDLHKNENLRRGA
jgi:hypothetical protein